MKKIELMVILVLLMFSVPVTAAEYVIQEGDTLSGIANKTGNTLKALLKINHLKETSIIIAGKKLHYISKEDLVEALDFWMMTFEAMLLEDPGKEKEIFYTSYQVETALFRALEGSVLELDPKFVLEKEITAKRMFVE